MRRPRELLLRTSPAGSEYLFKGPRCVKKRPERDWPLARTSGKICGGVVLRIAVVCEAGKGLASDKELQGGVQGGHDRVVSQVSSGAERCCC